MTVTSMLANAAAYDEARLAVSVTTGPVRVVYSTVEPEPGVAMASPSYSGSTAVDTQGACKVTVTGLEPRTRYWWRVEDAGAEDTSRTGTFLTPPAPGVQTSFTFAASGDAGQSPAAPGFTGTELQPVRISNHEVHATIGHRMLTEGWLFHLDLGDRTYYDLGNLTAGFPDSTLANYRQMYSDLQLQPNQRALYDSGSDVYIWDDHDYGPNDSDGTFVDKANAAQVYRERVPHHDLPESGAIYRSFQVGRVLVAIWDTRYERSPATDLDGPSKTMLGATQKAWFADLLATTTAEVIIIASSIQWMSGGAGSWPGYATERQEIADMITTAGKADRVVMISADAHVLAIDTGGNNAWGGWPCAIFAGRDASTGIIADPYDILAPRSDRNQYGTVTVTDLGGLITVKLTAWQGESEIASYTKAFAATPLVTAVDVTEVVSGSHTVIVEARVCEDYQTGPDPVGETIPVVSGDVRYDATATVWSNMTLETIGIDEYDLRSMFPRHPGDLLAPYGSEIFIRYGIDLGTSTLWTPMGYYRIDDTEQPDSPYGDIRVSGPDRMQCLIDARLTAPRQYRSSQAIGAVVSDLVVDVLPGAVIAWDDDTDQQPVGRDLVIEKERGPALQEIAVSRGKVVFFDSEGVLRIETAPDPTQIAWELKAGRNGVLVSSSRRVSREGMFNGVVASGQGTVDSPAIGIAVDVGADSPTRWGGRFGKVPYFHTSPVVADSESGYLAAVEILRRMVGMPYSVDFGAVPNPSLRPRQAVRIEQADGNREIHLPDTLQIPFMAGQSMRGTTREQTLVQVGRVAPGSPSA